MWRLLIMSGNIRLNPEELEEFAGRYADESGQVGEMVTRLRGLIGQLTEAWEGGAAEAFATQYEELEPSFQNMQVLLEDISRQLSSSANTLRDTDANIASQIRG